MPGLEYDPLTILTLPPTHETPEERVKREEMEAEAQRVSNKIDEEIKQEKAAARRQRNVIRVLLLGQSESGKSTTLKNFRMKYARTAWKQERASWRSVIQLNLLRSVNTIVDAIQAEIDNEPVESSQTTSTLDFGTDSDAQISATLPSQQSSSSTAPPSSDVSQIIPLTHNHQLLKLRLGPLRSVEVDLRRRLGAGADEDTGQISLDMEIQTRGSLAAKRSTKEFGVRRWEDALSASNFLSPSKASSHQGHGEQNDAEAVDEATKVIMRCKDDIKALWKDETINAILQKRKLRLEDSAGFFLDDLDRIATRYYEPSDEDVLRARLRTLGVQEYRIQFEAETQAQYFSGGQDFGAEWVLYDVGGSRTARQAWVPYFENVNAIIFLAPVSCFDERLLEDPSVNRLEDSFKLWKTVCESKLLSKATMILFLNKCDLLKRKLNRGVLIKHYLPSFQNRPNEAQVLVKYLKDKFRDTLRANGGERRISYFYATSVTDTKATATTLKAVRDSILREHLKNADLV